MPDNKALILQAIESAQRSLAVARELLTGGAIDQKEVSSSASQSKSELLGEIGTFDGENLVTDSNRKFQVPPNYASKSLLVVGDVMRMTTSSDGVRRFKQIQKVARVKAEGILTKKDGMWSVVSDQGTFRVLPASVKYFDGEIGDEAHIILPKEHKKLKSRWAALEKVAKEEKKEEKFVKAPEPKGPPSPKAKEKPQKGKKEASPKPARPTKSTKPTTKSTKGKETEVKPAEPKLKGEIKVEVEELR